MKIKGLWRNLGAFLLCVLNLSLNLTCRMSWIDRHPMSKSEIVAELKSKGQFDTNTRNELWMKAFKLYEIETKNKLSPSCGSCYNKVRQWLNS